MNKKPKWLKVFGVIFVFSLIIGAGVAAKVANAEQSGGSPNNNPTLSRIKTLYNALVADSYGADAAGAWGDWGAFWNRIYSAATWTATGNASVTDVKNTKTFYSNTRGQQTGTYPAVSNCSTQAYHDSYGAPVTETSNCSINPWTTNASPATGDDDQAGRGGYDPRTGLQWSQLLLNSAGTVAFSHASNSTWTWDGTTSFTVTAANATAGATYTNNGATFTVVTTIAGGTTLVTTGTAAAAASGTLTKASGTGDATITFSAISNGAANAAVGAKTAKQLCTAMGGSWRLPTQKELMQAYIDGSFWNLTQPSTYFWSATEVSATSAWTVTLGNGTTTTTNKTSTSNQVRCVR
jgi:hypothetical protein